MLRWALSLEPGAGSWATIRSTGTRASLRRPSTFTRRFARDERAPASAMRFWIREGTTTSCDARTARIVITADTPAVTSRATARRPYLSSRTAKRLKVKLFSRSAPLPEDRRESFVGRL
jgi:hypothetical protein